jgi:hypothetical protein
MLATWCPMYNLSAPTTCWGSSSLGRREAEHLQQDRRSIDGAAQSMAVDFVVVEVPLWQGERAPSSVLEYKLVGQSQY